MKKFLDTDHPGFRPLWIRVVVTVVCLAWGVVEIATGSPFWAMIFLGLGAYCVYAFFFDFDPERHGSAEAPDPAKDPGEE